MTLSKLKNIILSNVLILPLPLRLKTRLYYGLITDLFAVICEDKALFNCGQEFLCDETVKSLPKQGRWLDVGCGVAGPACYFASMYPNTSITGINISRTQLKKAKNLILSKGLNERVVTHFGDACEMPLRTDCFDGVYAIETAFHFPKKADFISESFRVLKSGGRFALADIVCVEKPPSYFQLMIAKIFHGWLASVKMAKVSHWEKYLRRAGFVDIHIKDISEQVFDRTFFEDDSEKSIMKKQIEKYYPQLKRNYTDFFLTTANWAHEWQGRDRSTNPLRYVLIEARKP